MILKRNYSINTLNKGNNEKINVSIGILVVFSLYLSVFPSQLPPKAAAKIEKYKKMAEEEKKQQPVKTTDDDVFDFTEWDTYKKKDLVDNRDKLNELNSWSFASLKKYFFDNKKFKQEKEKYKQNIEELSQQEKTYFNDINEKEWQSREQYYQNNQTVLDLEKNVTKASSTSFKTSRQTLDLADAIVAHLNSWSPPVVLKYLFNNQDYQKRLNIAQAEQKKARMNHSNLLAETITSNYKHETELLNNHYDKIKDSKDVNDQKAIQLIAQEIVSFAQPHDFNAFVKSTLPTKDRKLYVSYCEQQLRE